LKQLGICTTFYLNDYDDWLPEALTPDSRCWYDLLVQYDDSFKTRKTGAQGIYTCPSFKMFWKALGSYSGNYGMNDDFINHVKLANVKRPTVCAWIMDSYQRNATEVWYSFDTIRFVALAWDGYPYYYHNAKCVVSFLDGGARGYTSNTARSAAPGWKYPQP
jgi:hypothetical protein